MPFFPAAINLATVKEIENLEFYITYVNAFGSSLAVTVTEQSSNTTLTVTSNSIIGFYSDVFNQGYYRYRSKQNTLINVSSTVTLEAALSSVSQIFLYSADQRTSITYYYTARASDGTTQTYNIVVNNDWDTGRNQLSSLLSRTALSYVVVPGQIVRWINTTGNTITWQNDVLEIIDWTT